jgi:hypothetical protein
MKTLWRAGVMTTVLATGSCVVDMGGNATCTPDNNCIRNDDGTVDCEVGYRWEDESDPDNFHCVPDVPDAGALDG